MRKFVLFNYISLVCISSLVHAQDKSTHEAMQKRAQQVREKHAKYIKGISEGKINPYQRFFDAYPKLNQQVSDLQLLHRGWQRETKPLMINTVGEELLKQIQPVGSWLQIAEYDPSFNGKLSTDQIKTFEALERDPARRPANLAESKQKLTYTSSTANWFTIQHLPVPVTCKAPPESRVFFHAVAGGQFENGLSIIEKKADKNGNVATFWVSKGDAIHLAQIKIVSPQCSNILHYSINVMALNINFPAYLNAERMEQLKGLAPKVIQQKLKQFSKLDAQQLKQKALNSVPQLK